MDIINIQALIAQGRIATLSDIDTSRSYVQIGVYQLGNRQVGSGNANTYAPCVISLQDLGAGGGGGINGITTTSPLVSSGGLVPNISIPQAGPGTSGYLSSANWNTFNNKQNALGFTPENIGNKSTNTSLGISNTLYPTENAVKTYVDASVTGLLDDRGNFTPNAVSPGGWPTTGGSGIGGAILKGDLWYVDTAGFLGTASVGIGASFRALVDSPGQIATNWAILNVGLGYVPANELTQINTTSPLGGGGDLSANRTLTIQDAAANGLTKGAATFNASDFNDNGSGLISIDYANGQVASAGVNGFLSSSDWSTFNNKENALGYTPVPSTRNLTINGTTFDLSADRTWTVAAGVSSVTGTAPIISSGGATPAISISQATALNDGYLSSTDWNTFNNKANDISVTVGWLTSTNLTSNLTYYFGTLLNFTASTSQTNARRFRSPATGNFTTFIFATQLTTASVGPGTTIQLANITLGTSVNITTIHTWSALTYLYTGFNLAANQNDIMELRAITPTFTTPPTAVTLSGNLILRRS